MPKINKTFIDQVHPPESGQVFYRDSDLKGFALRITASGVKSFVIEKRVNGKVKRITIARYPDLTAEQARKQAHKLLGQIATGIDPVAEKKAQRSKSVT